ncbi:hypothetical protein [Oceanibacterium hippocampi]|uniref:hypothetical protein n=1 Tax=Oceanibacterium hippocampi TaxID=745714 RepID=UPI00111BEC98|nr:hypothetical protein [Oceanibacterium hippocampi]
MAVTILVASLFAPPAAVSTQDGVETAAGTADAVPSRVWHRCLRHGHCRSDGSWLQLPAPAGIAIVLLAVAGVARRKGWF